MTTSSTGKKIKRFHREIFFPEWSERAIGEFLEAINSGKSIVFSYHALEKIMEYGFEYGKILSKYLIKCVRKSSLVKEGIFEFYAVKEEIKKACFRFSFENFPVDLIFIISRDGTIITMYTTGKEDNHSTLNKKLYAKE